MVDPKAHAAELIKRLGITAPPIDVKGIAKQLDAKIVVRSDFGDDLSGMLIKEDGKFVIGVNKNHSLVRQRFTIAHEIGHMLLHAEIIDKVHIDKSFNYSLKRDGRSKLGQDRMEIQANQFAAELLMPTKLLQEEFISGYLDFENGSEALAKKYGVSIQAMSYKIMDVFPFADAC